MSTKDIIKNSVLENFASDLTLTRILIALGITVILALYIFFLYRLCTANEFYSKNFNKSVALLSVITASIVLAMQSNLVISLGMVGALSIVRFRNAIKDSMDLVFLFWSISVGIICGAGLYEIALITSLLITLLLFVLELVPGPKTAKLLVVNSTDTASFPEIETIVKKYGKNCRVKSRNLTAQGMDLVISLKSEKETALLNELHGLPHIVSVSILSHDGETHF